MIVRYVGQSMFPLLKGGDEMKVVSCKKGNIKDGDVVVFRAHCKSTNVVHRILSSDSRGMVTKGDNNPNVDESLLNYEDIIGRVVYAKRGGKKIKIYGGATGLLTCRALHIRKKIDLYLSSILKPLYLRIAKTGLFKNRLKTKVISFKRGHTFEMQIIMGSSVIGMKKPGDLKWRIRRPFRIFVDESSLP